jgi:hypothetical protein
MGKRFSSSQMLGRIAVALEVDSPRLFSERYSEKEFVRQLRENIIADIERVMMDRLRELREENSGLYWRAVSAYFRRGAIPCPKR